MHLATLFRFLTERDRPGSRQGEGAPGYTPVGNCSGEQRNGPERIAGAVFVRRCYSWSALRSARKALHSEALKAMCPRPRFWESRTAVVRPSATSTQF